MPAQELNAIVIRRVELNHELALFRIQPDGWTYPEFRAGQFANIGLPWTAPKFEGCEPDTATPTDPEEIIRRSYSISSSPAEAKQFNYVELYIDLVKTGIFSPRLWMLHPGDKLWMMTRPAGMFTMQNVAEGKHHVYVATGTGLSPYMAMLRTELHKPGETRFAVLHGVRHADDLGFQAELETMERMSGGRLAYFPIVSRDHQDPVPWQGLKGRVQSVWQSDAIAARWGFEPSPEHTHVYLCGSPNMIDEMQALLFGQGYRKHTMKDKDGQVHIESYW